MKKRVSKGVFAKNKILILGGGFGGIEVLKKIQQKLPGGIHDISIVSKDNFFLFTPMLPEVSSGMIETRHIVTPIRAFCKKAKFYEAIVKDIDFEKKQVVVSNVILDKNMDADWHENRLSYDYLIISMGGETNFFGMEDVKKYSYTMKNLGDAIVLRNHVIDMLEQASIEQDDKLRTSLMTFVVVGGGFAGVETVGELNGLIREAVRDFYDEIDVKNIRVILADGSDRILHEVSDDLSQFATKKLKNSGIEIILKNQVSSATKSSMKLHDGTIIQTHTIVWTGGVVPERLVKNLKCEHDDHGRILVDGNLKLKNLDGVYAIGDCASLIDPHTSKPYPPTAQNATEQAKVVVNNLISSIKGRNQSIFDYKSRGLMAQIGKRNAVGILFGLKVHGLIAWMIWRYYYLSHLPTFEKKLRVIIDWSIDLFFKPDITRLKIFSESQEIQTKDSIEADSLKQNPGKKK